MIEKLEEVVRRFERLEADLSNPDILADSGRLQKVAKERSSLEKLVGTYRTYREVLADLKSAHRNPLLLNRERKLCVELTSDATLQRELRQYMTWRPEKLVLRWFGPFFQKRAFALLLVCQRLRATIPKMKLGLNRDIQHMLVRCLSRVEHVYARPYPRPPPTTIL